MSNTTDCNKCIFYSSDRWCEFDIPEVINNPNVSVNPLDHTISNYSCSYAFGNETLENNKDKYTKTEIQDYIFTKNRIRYSLILNFDTINKSITEIIDKIYQLSFMPKNIICFGKNVEGEMVSLFETQLQIPWKVNKILPHIDEVISIISGVDVIVNKHESNCFFYVSTSNTFETIDDTMNYIHIESVINQNYGIFMKNISTLDGLFMTYNTYNILGIEKIKLFYDTSIFFTDNPGCKLILYND